MVGPMNLGQGSEGTDLIKEQMDFLRSAFEKGLNVSLAGELADETFLEHKISNEWPAVKMVTMRQYANSVAAELGRNNFTIPEIATVSAENLPMFSATRGKLIVHVTVIDWDTLRGRPRLDLTNAKGEKFRLFFTPDGMSFKKQKLDNDFEVGIISPFSIIHLKDALARIDSTEMSDENKKIKERLIKEVISEPGKEEDVNDPKFNADLERV